MPDSDINTDEQQELEEQIQDKPVKKVELDLDDAPFLQTDEPPPMPAAIDEPAEKKEDDSGKKNRKKKLIIIAAVLVILIGASVAGWWFFLRTPPPPPPKGPEPQVIVVPSEKQETGPVDLVEEFAPFVVPVNVNLKNTTFLICKFSAITREPQVKQEISQQLIPLRDAIYFYLRGKDSAFLLDGRNGEAIKKDLLSVFNDYLTQGKLEDIVFESYLSR